MRFIIFSLDNPVVLDYVPLKNVTMDIARGRGTTCKTIEIVDDNIYEETEKFAVEMISLDPSVLATRKMVIVFIVDDEEPCLSFTADQYQIVDEGGQFNICVELNTTTEKQIPYEITISPLEGKNYCQVR